jgi:excisionase family DNA binding protein
MTALHDDFLTVAEAAAILRVAPSTIRRWIRAGQLPAYRLGSRRLALRRDDLDRMVAPFAYGANGVGTVGNADAADDAEAARQRAAKVDRRLTRQEIQRGFAALERVRRINAEIMTERGGEPFTPSSTEILYTLREERTRQLTGE